MIQEIACLPSIRLLAPQRAPMILVEARSQLRSNRRLRINLQLWDFAFTRRAKELRLRFALLDLNGFNLGLISARPALLSLVLLVLEMVVKFAAMLIPMHIFQLLLDVVLCGVTFRFVLNQILELMHTDRFLLLIVVAGAWDILNFFGRGWCGRGLVYSKNLPGSQLLRSLCARGRSERGPAI